MSLNENPEVSVLIPSLNNEDYIAECVNSVINQSLENIEIICIDAGSTDSTLSILNDFSKRDSRVKIIQSDKRSYGYQMNLGMNEAIGQYIGIVESDDYIDERMFEELISLSNNAEMDIIKSSFFHVYDEGDIKIDENKRELDNVNNPFTIYDRERFLKGHPSIWAGIYKRDFLMENNIYFLEEDGAAWVDNPFFYETAFAADKIIYTPKAFYYYRESNVNSSSNSLESFTIPIKRMIDNLNVVEKYGCKDENILYIIYVRAFAYLDNISKRDGFEEHTEELWPLIHEMFLMMDENIVCHRFNLNQQELYYKFLSHLPFLESDNNLLKEDYGFIIKENEFLYYKIDKLNEEIKKSKSRFNKNKKTNSKLKSENSKLKRELKSIESSKSFKIGTLVAAPIRRIKGVKK